MTSFTALDKVAAALLSVVGDELSFRPVCTRVLLRTGVNIREPRSDQITDPVAVHRVVTALTAMGYVL
jgi:hypothetical protein